MKLTKKQRSRAAKKGWRKRSRRSVKRNTGVHYVMQPVRANRGGRRRMRSNTMFYATANGRRSTRRNSRFRPFSRMSSNSHRSRHMKRNPYYVFQPNSRGRHRMRSNKRHSTKRMLRNMAADVMKDVLIPVAGGTAGFVAARVISNAVAQVSGITNLLDKGQPAELADNTKIVTNLLAIAATIGVGTKVDIVRKNQGAIVTGMGLALVDKLLGKVGGAAGNYLSGMRGFGEYFEQPVAGMGEYFEQPVAGMGEYFEQPVAGLGAYIADPNAGMGAAPDRIGAMYATAGLGNQAAVDGLLDVAEAAAGVDQAAAGIGLLQYATAGLGQVTIPPVVDVGFKSIQTPTDVAAMVGHMEQYTADVPQANYAQEGRGYAGGIFQGTVFTGERC